METTYKIEWLEKKTTSTGKEKADVTLSANGVNTDATIWGDFPDFANLAPGSTITGTLKPASDPKYRPSLNAPRPTTAPKTNGFKQKVIEEAQNRKRGDIADAQDNKYHSVKVASTFREAMENARLEFQESRRLSTTGPTLEQMYEKWREYCWMHYDVKDTDYPPTV